MHLTNPEIAARLAGMPDPESSRSVEGHLGRCDTCRRRLAVLQRQDDTLREILTDHPGGDFFEQLLVEGARRIHPHPGLGVASASRRFWAGVAAALATVLCAVFAWWALQGLMNAQAAIAKRVTPAAAAARAKPARAQVGLLCGIVHDTRGDPIAQATVMVWDMGVGIRTDRSGHFCLIVPTGKRTLSIKAAGFESVREGITVGQETSEFEVVLHRASRSARLRR